MWKNLLGFIAMLAAATAFAAVDINKASEADLDGIKGIGPSLSGRILAERKKAPFKDWADLIARVQGVGPGSARKFSAEGLTVNGAGFDTTQAAAAGAAAQPASR